MQAFKAQEGRPAVDTVSAFRHALGQSFSKLWSQPGMPAEFHVKIFTSKGSASNSPTVCFRFPK